MKLVINTQHRENYAAHNEDFVPGVSQDYWKFKGGSTYVVENINPPSARNIEMDGIPTLTALIEDRNESYEEYILGYDIVEDDAVVCEEWETPYVLEYDSMLKAWRMSRITINGDMGYMRSEIAEKHESWMALPKNDRRDYKVMWVMTNGHRGIGNEFLEEQLKEVA
jgi:hypothetical protein